MNQLEWTEILGWGQKELDDIRYAAYCYIKEGIYDIALVFFDALRILTPPNAYDLQTVGALYLQIGNGLKALEFLERALKIDPQHFPSLLNRAKALFMLGYKKQALSQASELESCPNQEIANQASALVLAFT